jgi:hypothetical protein
MSVSGQRYIQTFNACISEAAPVAGPVPRLPGGLGAATLGSTIEARALAYRQRLEAGVGQEELADTRRYIVKQRALGDDRFQAMVEKPLNRPAAYRSGGRPKAKVI